MLKNTLFSSPAVSEGLTAAVKNVVTGTRGMVPATDASRAKVAAKARARLPGASQSGQDAEREANADPVARRTGKWLEESCQDEECSAHEALNRYSLPPTNKSDTHSGYLSRIGSHFREHMRLHGHGASFTKRELEFMVAHKHLRERGHINHSLDELAHGSDKEHIEHARGLVSQAVYGEHNPKMGKIMATKVLRRLHGEPTEIKSRPPHPGGGLIGY